MMEIEVRFKSVEEGAPRESIEEAIDDSKGVEEVL
jgi:hypothetical protein